MNHKKLVISIVFYCLSTSIAMAQIDSAFIRRLPQDSTSKSMNMDAIYNRPFLAVGKLPVSSSGYMEANWQHIGEDGVSNWHQFQFRRFTLFVASTISTRIKFISELEFKPADNKSPSNSLPWMWNSAHC